MKMKNILILLAKTETKKNYFKNKNKIKTIINDTKTATTTNCSITSYALCHSG